LNGLRGKGGKFAPGGVVQIVLGLRAIERPKSSDKHEPIEFNPHR
jgi:hypothetical protein